MSRWFRHYAGMMRDDKLVRVAIKSNQTIERVLWVWGAILESASEIDDGGRYDIDPDEIAYFLRADQVDVGAIISNLESSGRVSNGAVVSWSDRQYQSDKSASRQARYRERKRAQEDSNGSPVTCDGGDVTVTSPLRHGDAPDTETDTETDNTPPTPPRGKCVPVPEWIPPEAWAGFKAMRTKIRKPMTDRAQEMVFHKLDELRKKGHDPGKVLDQSTMRCWQDVFELKPLKAIEQHGKKAIPM